MQATLVPASFMLLCFVIGGGLCTAGAWSIVARLRTLGRMIPVEGVVVRVHTRHARRRRAVYNFPVIQFRTLSGDTRTFRSETGDGSRQSRYFPGQKIAILYDPLGEASPLIKSWWGVWSASVFLLVGGLLFLAVALNVWLALGKDIVRELFGMAQP